MSKMSELELTVKELRNAARSLTTVADSLTTLFGGDNTEPDREASTTAAQSKHKAEPKTITLEQVRAVLAEKSRGGHTDEVRELLGKHGAAKLSEIDPKEYPAILAEAARIGLAEGDGNG